METRWMPAAGAYRTSRRVSHASVPGSRILSVPIPVADTKEFPTPIIWCGEIGVSAEKSDSTHEMCVDAPESRYSSKSMGLFAKREISAEARRMFAVSTQRSPAEALASHGCKLPSRIQLAYSPRSVAVIMLLMSVMAALTGSGSGLYLMPPIQMVPLSPTFRRVFDVLLVVVTLLRGSHGLMRMASHSVHCRAIASKADWPAILPPCEMQNLTVWPSFLQFGQMVAHGGMFAGIARVGGI